MTYDEIETGQTVRVENRKGWVAKVVRKFISNDAIAYVELEDAKGRWAFNYPHQLELM